LSVGKKVSLVWTGVLLVSLVSVSALGRRIGPDNFGYRASDEVPFLWEPLSPVEGGSGANVITQDDRNNVPVRIHGE